MDRLQFQRGLVALSGLALVLATSGCRDRNMRVPPPAHYTDGDYAVPEADAYSAYPPLSSEPSGMDPYAGVGSNAPGAGTFDPAATQTSGVFAGVGGGDVVGASAIQGYDPSGGFGVPPVPGSNGPSTTEYSGPYASPSSPSPYAVDPYATGEVADPYAGLNAAAGAPSFLSTGGDTGIPSPPSPEEFPGLDGFEAAPPIPDHLPEMP